MCSALKKFHVGTLALIICLPALANATEEECQAVVKKTDAEIAEKTKSPPPGGVVPSMERVMWMAKYMIDAMEASPSCTGVPNADAFKKQMKNSGEVAEANCKSLATRPCVAQSY